MKVLYAILEKIESKKARIKYICRPYMRKMKNCAQTLMIKWFIYNIAIRAHQKLSNDRTVCKRYRF